MGPCSNSGKPAKWEYLEPLHLFQGHKNKAPPLFSDGAQTTGHRNPLNQRSLPKRERGQEHRSLGSQSTVSADDVPITFWGINLFPNAIARRHFFKLLFAASGKQ